MNDELLNFFTVTEETFQKKTVNAPHEINLNVIESYLLKDSLIIIIYNNLMEESGVKLANDLKYNLLENMLKLYFFVRSFSFAVDLT